MLNEKENKMIETVLDHFFLVITLIDKQEKGVALVEALLFKMIGSLIVSLPPEKRPVIVDFVNDLSEEVKNERFEDTEDLHNFLKNKED